MSLNGLPILPGQVLARDLNGHYFYVDATPDMVNNAMRLTQDLHASGQSRPKGDAATLADFLIACEDRSARNVEVREASVEEGVTDEHWWEHDREPSHRST